MERLVGDVRTGGGRVVLVEGSPGIGKTALLAAARERAIRAGLRVLSARGDELERELAFSVARQLFEHAVAQASTSERSELLSGAAHLARPVVLLESGIDTAVGDPFAALHGLYWLCANLAERSPLALLVDDAQWADSASLRWLGYLARRIEALPVLVGLALRSDAPPEDAPLIAAVAGQGEVERLTIRPLSDQAAAELVQRTLGRVPDPSFSRACHRATGGNPFYLRELVRAIRDDAIQPTASSAARVPVLAPASVARSVLLRLGRLGGDAVALARAIAILGPDAELRHAAKLAGLHGDAAQLALDRLITAEIVRSGTPIAFAHPILAASVEEELKPGARSIEHKRAARLLDDDGVTPDRVALHLLATEPQGDPWVVERLLTAAAVSLGRSAPDAAASFLRRALAEPPPRERRADILYELGRAEQLTGSEQSITHLAESVEGTDDVRQRAERTPDLAGALVQAGRPARAVAVCERALVALGGSDRELGLRLEAARWRAAIQDPATAPLAAELRERFHDTLGGENAAERELLVQLAHHAAARGTSAKELGETIRLALADGRLLAEQGGDSIVVYEAITALAFADHLNEADDLIAEALTDIHRRGSLTGYMSLSTFRAQTHLRRGLVAEAEAEARGALDAARLDAPPFIVPGAFALLIEALVEQGDLASAEHELASFGLMEPVPSLFPFTMLLHSRALLRLAQRRPREALADALRCGDRQAALQITNPALIPWRSTAALAHAAGGAPDVARQLAAEELRLARAFGAPRATGVTLRAAGLVEPARSGLPLLKDAVGVLSRSPATLEQARALVDLGILLRHTGDRAHARQRLREGLDLAHRCGATALARRAREELIVAGARPRRDAIRGRDALTASELRVARMAAEGLTNREIAQTLFVTSKTVEAHLYRAFQKLGVTMRTELDAVLNAGPQPPSRSEAPRGGQYM